MVPAGDKMTLDRGGCAQLLWEQLKEKYFANEPKV